MPIEVISTDQAAAYNVSSSDDVFLLEGVNIISTADGISGIDATQSSTTINVQGTIIANRGIDLWGGAVDILNNSFIYVGHTGGIYATADAIVLEDGINNQVINHGEITSQETGIYSQGGDLRIENHGSINSNGSSGQGAIQIISSSGSGDNVREIINTGIISGSPAVITDSTSATISNNGGAEFHIDNSGSIIGGDDRAVYSTAAANFINNSGLIDGDMTLTNVTRMFNSGVIDGDVLLSSVDDVYFGSDDGIITGELDLNSGNDYAFLGNSGGNVFGGSGNDTIQGGNGNDSIDGGADMDFVNGAAGDDFVTGDAGNDRVRGGEGDDMIFGGTGVDYMWGGEGDDIINGGQGMDFMTGGAGNDTFVFFSASESTNAGTSWDRIMDFTQGEDQIDLSQFNARFIGTGAYAANGNIAEIRIFEDPNGDTRVFVDVNADGVSDMRFYLVNVTGVTADDFIL